MTRSLGISSAAASILVALTAAPVFAGGQDKVLNFCRQNPSRCAISVAALSEGWEGHLNPDRPQALGSTFKVMSLIAYAQAVAAGKLNPAEAIDREEWARYLTLDGGALAASWNALGRPTTVKLDDLATTMVLHSDNAFPDWLLARLGPTGFAGARQLFPFIDPPAGVSAMFGLFAGAQGESGSGNRIASDYGNFGVGGYQGELQTFFAALKAQPAVAAAAQAALCIQPPWRSGPAPCTPPAVGISEENYRTVLRYHFIRSTTRSYLRVFRGLLERNLLSSAAQHTVERHLESWFDLFPILHNSYVRYGIKGGSLSTTSGLDELTWAHYLETTAHKRFVVVVFLRGLTSATNPPTAADLNDFAQQFSFDAGFRTRVRHGLLAKEARPNLLASIVAVSRQGNTVTLDGRVDNVSPNAVTKPFQVDLRLWLDRNPVNNVVLSALIIPSLGGNKAATFRLVGTSASSAIGQQALLWVDSKNAVLEQDEGDNLNWSRVH